MGPLLGALPTLALAGLLVAREIVGAASDDRVTRWGRRLDVAIAPLLIVFVITVGLRIVHSL
jgi:hypothetical protein